MSIEGDTLSSVAVADLDGDGNADFVSTGTNRYGVALGDGTGHFTVRQFAAPGPSRSGVALGDFDGDGRADLAYAGMFVNHPEYRLGDGTGRFGTVRHLLPSSGDGMSPAIVAADLDGDGDDDIAVGADSGIDVWTNAGGGSFGEPVVLDAGLLVTSLVVADVDIDGDLDLVAGHSGGQAQVTVALGLGAGEFAEGVTTPVETFPPGTGTPIGVADIDGDTHLDVYGGVNHRGAVFVMAGAGDGTFAGPTFSALTTNGVFAVTTADVDVDGHLDIVTDSSVCFGDGAGHVGECHEILGGRSIATADFDGNGQPDLVAAPGLRGQEADVLLNHLDGARDHD
jgi:hypothetical protein